MNRIISFLISNPLHKLVALGLTILLYAVLNEGKQQQKDILNVPVIVECDPEVHVAGASRRAEVRITVKGSERRLKNMEVNHFTGKVNISRNMPGFDSGNVKIQLSEKHFSLPVGVEIKSIVPNVLVFPVQRKISREIPVKTAISGHPADGYECAGVTCIPARVLVSGPEQLVNGLTEIETETVMIGLDEYELFSKRVNLRNPMPGELELGTGSVDVSVNIQQMPTKSRTLENIPISWILPTDQRMQVTRIGENQVIVTDNTVDVEVSGQQSVVDTISGKDLVVLASLDGQEIRDGGEFQVVLQASLRKPQGWVTLKVIPESVRVRIKLLEQDSKYKEDKSSLTNKK